MHHDWSALLWVGGRGVPDECDEWEGVQGNTVVRPGRIVVLVHTALAHNSILGPITWGQAELENFEELLMWH